jgi:hypothetical protein
MYFLLKSHFDKSELSFNIFHPNRKHTRLLIRYVNLAFLLCVCTNSTSFDGNQITHGYAGDVK